MQITPSSKESNLTSINFHSLTHDLQSSFAYHTPPIESRKSESCTPNKQLDVNSSAALLNNISALLSTLTKSYSSTKINNSVINIRPFLIEILKRSKCNKQTAIVAAYYFKKLYTGNKFDNFDNKIPEFFRCAKRIFLTCLIISHKFNNDNTFSMKSWSHITGLKQKDLTVLERWCLSKLNFELFINVETFKKWEAFLINLSKNNIIKSNTSHDNLQMRKRSIDLDVNTDLDCTKKLCKKQNLVSH